MQINTGNENSQNSHSNMQNQQSENLQPNSQNSQTNSPYSLNTAYALYLLLGFFSGHRFYLGRPVSAIFQMLGGFGFLIWSIMLLVAFMLSSPDVIEFFNSIYPNLNLDSNSAKTDKIIKPIIVFALPNLIYLIWIISDFFRLENMVKESNAQKGVFSENLQPNKTEMQSSLSSAKTLIYIGCGILILMAILGLFRAFRLFMLYDMKTIPLRTRILLIIGTRARAYIIKRKERKTQTNVQGVKIK